MHGRHEAWFYQATGIATRISACLRTVQAGDCRWHISIPGLLSRPRTANDACADETIASVMNSNSDRTQTILNNFHLMPWALEP